MKPIKSTKTSGDNVISFIEQEKVTNMSKGMRHAKVPLTSRQNRKYWRRVEGLLIGANVLAQGAMLNVDTAHNYMTYQNLQQGCWYTLIFWSAVGIIGATVHAWNV